MSPRCSKKFEGILFNNIKHRRSHCCNEQSRNWFPINRQGGIIKPWTLLFRAGINTSGMNLTEPRIFMKNAAFKRFRENNERRTREEWTEWMLDSCNIPKIASSGKFARTRGAGIMKNSEPRDNFSQDYAAAFASRSSAPGEIMIFGIISRMFSLRGCPLRPRRLLRAVAIVMCQERAEISGWCRV